MTFTLVEQMSNSEQIIMWSAESARRQIHYRFQANSNLGGLFDCAHTDSAKAPFITVEYQGQCNVFDGELGDVSPVVEPQGGFLHDPSIAT